MALIVHAMGAYASYSHEDTGWRQADYNVNKFVKALKGEPINGYANLRDVDGKWVRIAQDSADAAYPLFGGWAAACLRKLDLGDITLVPVPSSSCISFADVTTPVKMARAIKARMNGAPAVGRWLRFAEPMLQSHAGGTRNKAALEEAMRCSPAATECRVVLVDDVKTTGGHLRACASVLRKAGVTVETVVVAASTVWDQHPDPLNVEPVDLEAVSDFNWDDPDL